MSTETAPIKLAGYFLEWKLIEDEKAELAERSKSLFKAMKDEGFNTKAARIVFRDKRFSLEATASDLAQVEEAEAINDVYRTALDTGLSARAHPAPAHVEIIEEFNPETGEITEQLETADEIHERPSNNDKAYPEAGPQAEASLAGTGSGMLAGREGRSEGEAASVGLPTNSPSAATPADAVAEPQAPQAQTATASHSEPFQPPAFLRKSAADYRPNCQHPEACASSGLKHCYSCTKLLESEVAA